MVPLFQQGSKISPRFGTCNLGSLATSGGTMTDFHSFVHRLLVTCFLAQSSQLQSPEDLVHVDIFDLHGHTSEEVDVDTDIDENWTPPMTPSAHGFDTAQIRRPPSLSREPDYRRPRIGSAMLSTTSDRCKLGSVFSAYSEYQPSSASQYSTTSNSQVSPVVSSSPTCSWQSGDSATSYYSHAPNASGNSVSSYSTALESGDSDSDEMSEEDEDFCFDDIPNLPGPCAPSKAALVGKPKFIDPFSKKSGSLGWVKEILSDYRRGKTEGVQGVKREVSPFDSSTMTRKNKRDLRSLRKLFPEEYVVDSRV
ncbi:hypothetical protein L218DRAFT_439884 [Marasmius fiardii PR-910]|nr:hypothetical protein L218DRAFT_439884 [Marasmius fiardii PR-910]